MKRLYKSKDKKIDGVCAGIAEYFNVDPTLVRVAWAILVFVAGSGVFAYILCMLIMPEQPNAIEE